jgi:hypothetical protein
VPDSSSDKNMQTLVSELWELVVAYAKQETVDPLKTLGRFLGFGVAGSVLLALGGVLISIGIVRLLQQEAAPHLVGHWSWVPYAAAGAFATLGIGLSVRAIGTDRRRVEREQAHLRNERG